MCQNLWVVLLINLAIWICLLEENVSVLINLCFSSIGGKWLPYRKRKIFHKFFLNLSHPYYHPQFTLSPRRTPKPSPTTLHPDLTPSNPTRQPHPPSNPTHLPTFPPASPAPPTPLSPPSRRLIPPHSFRPLSTNSRHPSLKYSWDNIFFLLTKR